MKQKLEVTLVGGFYRSGSSAVIDFLKEFNDLHVFTNEFVLLTYPDGISGLENHLTDNWSFWGGDLAVKRFMKLVRVLNRKSCKYLWDGKNYKDEFTSEFYEMTKSYIDDLVCNTFKGKWSGCKWNFSSLQYFMYRLKRKLGLKPTFDIGITSPASDFKKKTRTYLQNLFIEALKENNSTDCNKIILNLGSNLIAAGKLLSYFDRAKLILVERDPRDKFVELNEKQKQDLNGEQFVDLHKNMRKIISRDDKESSDVLNLKFERLVKKHKEVSNEIINFLNLSKSQHLHPKKYFKPEVSRRNIAQWKDYKPEAHIRYIEEKLMKNKEGNFYAQYNS